MGLLSGLAVPTAGTRVPLNPLQRLAPHPQVGAGHRALAPGRTVAPAQPQGHVPREAGPCHPGPPGSRLPTQAITCASRQGLARFCPGK